MKPMQDAQFSYSAHFFENIFFYSEINVFFIYCFFFFFFFWGGGGVGVVVEVILEDFISEIV